MKLISFCYSLKVISKYVIIFWNMNWINILIIIRIKSDRNMHVFLKIKSWKYLPQVEVSCPMHFWLSWSKCWPGPHDTSVHLPNGDTDSMTKHSLNDWHLPSTGSFTLFVQLFIMGLNACRWPLTVDGHLFGANVPLMHRLYHSHSAVNGRLSPWMHSLKKISFLK